jgi:hypothetical protein
MSALSQEQIGRIKQIFHNLDPDWAIINDLVPQDEEQEISEAMLADMRKRGLPVDYPPGTAGLWGGLSAMEIKNYLVSVAAQRITRHRDQIYKVVCKDFGYCKRRREKKFESEGVTLAIGVADALLTAITSFPLPVASVSVYLVKNKILDQWCGCKETKPDAKRFQDTSGL